MKLSSLPTSFPQSKACRSALGVGLRCFRTMTSEWDTDSVEETTADRTIFVDNAGLSATDFGLPTEQQNALLIDGSLPRPSRNSDGGRRWSAWNG